MEETGTGLLLGDSHHNLARLQEDEWQVQVQRQPFSGVNALEDAVTRHQKLADVEELSRGRIKTLPTTENSQGNTSAGKDSPEMTQWEILPL
jgi:hypothetical protein